ncbi:MAG: hypothetical protein A2284_13855 [Deltaproteobacteria bacterium RIFOXYA12_FULL_61_11]|nr:MAG: hypothetical protein A2284_13855 [Deltaproteobacteria bacterium RIFOXYA12_FULL_61_11]
MITILIADDLPENRHILISLFTGHGYEVLPATNGAEALALAQSSPPDLILTDILMPVMDGFELCRRWKRDARLKSIPFIFYTATYTDPKDERLALSLGADRYLIKPQKIEVLLEVVREVLEDHPRERDLLSPLPPGDERELLCQHREEMLRLHNEALAKKLQQKIDEFETEKQEHERTSERLRKALEELAQSRSRRDIPRA